MQFPKNPATDIPHSVYLITGRNEVRLKSREGIYYSLANATDHRT